MYNINSQFLPGMDHYLKVHMEQGRLRQKDYEFKVSLGNTVRHHLKKLKLEQEVLSNSSTS